MGILRQIALEKPGTSLRGMMDVALSVAFELIRILNRHAIQAQSYYDQCYSMMNNSRITQEALAQWLGHFAERVAGEIGHGIPKEKLDALRAQLRKYPGVSGTQQGEHIGLVNVNGRIRLCCGEAYGLEVESREQAYTRVSIRLPIVESTPKNDTHNA